MSAKMVIKKEMELEWGKCTGNNWCSFANLNLSHETFTDLKGVYIIWSGKTTVRVGSGIIKDRIASHRKDNEITSYENLKVTWAKVNALQMEGVEKYLADALNPAVGERFPNRTPIKVNLPS